MIAIIGLKSGIVFGLGLQLHAIMHNFLLLLQCKCNICNKGTVK